MIEKRTKRAKLMEDEFNPHKAIKSFWMLPKHVAALSELSNGAKVMYAVLVGMAGTYGTAFPKRKRLQMFLGNPSDKTLYRWQCELEKYELIRVRQKGRGLSNNYYFLRSPLLENEDVCSPREGTQFVYRGPQSTEPMLVNLETAKQLFQEDVFEWYAESIQGEEKTFPKPVWKVPQN